MKKENEIKAIQEYQCSGCIVGHDIKCFKPNTEGLGCGKHIAGTIMVGAGKLFLGMPKPFSRLGVHNGMTPKIFNSFEEYDGFDKWNIPVWKYLKDGHTFVRGLRPRRNEPFIFVFLEDCMAQIKNVYEVTEEDVKFMD
jgi:hypothetical protein